jgi:hypothetical protein
VWLRDLVVGLWRRVEGDSVVAIGACEKLRVAAAVVSRCVRAADDVQVGRDRALERQRVAGLEAMLLFVNVVECLRLMLMLLLCD